MLNVFWGVHEGGHLNSKDGFYKGCIPLEVFMEGGS